MEIARCCWHSTIWDQNMRNLVFNLGAYMDWHCYTVHIGKLSPHERCTVHSCDS